MGAADSWLVFQGQGVGGRVPIERLTAVPGMAIVPAPGFCLPTVPMLLHVLSTKEFTVPTAKPEEFRIDLAPDTLFPRTSGTDVVFCHVEPLDHLRVLGACSLAV